jgi:hypothetical protein
VDAYQFANWNMTDKVATPSLQVGKNILTKHWQNLSSLSSNMILHSIAILNKKLFFRFIQNLIYLVYIIDHIILVFQLIYLLFIIVTEKSMYLSYIVRVILNMKELFKCCMIYKSWVILYRIRILQNSSSFIKSLYHRDHS